MKIQKIQAYAVSIPLETTYWVSNEIIDRCSQIIVQVLTDEGVTGVATLHGRSMPTVLQVVEQLSGYLAGMDALAHEAIWAKVFGLTTISPDAARASGAPSYLGADKRPALLAAMAGIDIALWDIKGKAVSLPVWRLLGGDRTSIRAYVTGGYYQVDRDLFDIGPEMAGYVSQGFNGVKMKVGGLSLPADVARVKAVRDAVGPSTMLMVDANCAYTLEQAIEAIRAFEPYDVYWFEEPLHWYDSVRAMGKLAQYTHVALASGESEQHSWACRDLIDLGAIRYMEFDATRSGGVTEWLRVAAYAQLHGVSMATHHDPHIHGHLAAAVPNGACVEVFLDEKRDPLWKMLFRERAQLRDGQLHLSDLPGFGFDIDWDVVKRFHI
ncbi:mandelate racemase/muconate lactonizing enzyme family protein [Candidimonas humi]|uniref:Mandelate racemase/muconate lactonizing enzyme family protein n=1 Tax=Candidimonas humi TaxID=683355 RepID=A0ABV8NYN5_9BURK|nr:mandelate racemase/muconate lactonizing enzyme family protein [Candidimonas humi]MBV6306320.1 mandelate racemase/muconate lactonizing enzyme family protein [Candidimonas humi]